MGQAASSRISRTRRRFWTFGVIAAALLSWWAQVYDPLSDRMAEQRAAITKLRQENERLGQRIERLAAYADPPASLLEELQQRKHLLIPGRVIEEVNPAIQTTLQEVADRTGVSIKSYKDLPSGQWKEYSLARIELQIETTTENLAKLLEALDNLKKVVQVEKVTVSYRKAKGAELQVVMQVGALFVAD